MRSKRKAFSVLALGACVFCAVSCSASNDGSSPSGRTFYYMTFPNGEPPTTQDTPVHVSQSGSPGQEELSILEYFWQQLFSSGRGSVDGGAGSGSAAPPPTSSSNPSGAESRIGGSRGRAGEDEQLRPISAVAPEVNCTLVTKKFLLCDDDESRRANRTGTPDSQLDSSEEDTPLPPSEPPSKRASSSNIFTTSKTLIMVFLAVCAGFSGCGLVVILATGTQTFRQRIRIFSQAEADETNRQNSRRLEMQSSRATKAPPRPVVILGPNNDILVGFAVSSPERKPTTDSQHQQSDDIRIGANGGGRVATPVSPLNPARLAVSPLSRSVRTPDDPRSPGQPVTPSRVSPRVLPSEA